MSQDSQDWSQQSERSNPFTLRLIRWIALHIGRSVARLLLYPIVIYYLLTSPRAIRASRHYLQRVYGKPVGITQIARHMYFFAATILDRVYFLTDQHHRFRITLHNHEIINNYVENKQGCILLGTHLGSFEVLRSLAIGKNKFPLKVLMYSNHNQMITKALDALNPEIAKSVINLADQDAMLQMQEALEQGQLVGMLGDRVTGNDRAVRCKLLGDETDFPAGPALLASIFKVPVVMFYGLYQGSNRYDIYFESLAEQINIARDNRDQQAQQWTQKYVSCIEHYIKLSPYNWFNFFDYWHDVKD